MDPLRSINSQPPASEIPPGSTSGPPPTQMAVILDERGALKNVPVVGEYPLTIVINGTEIVTLMTLGLFPEELALGYLKNQRLVTDLRIIDTITVDWQREAVELVTVEGAPWLEIKEKLGQRILTTGCGQGTIFSCTLDGLYDIHLTPMGVPQSTIQRLLRAVAKRNTIYRKAGAVHACALCNATGVEIFVEDVGRHNAADTIAGRMWREGLSGRDKILYTTGRLTSEIVMKTAQMEIPVLLSRSGVTHMGLELAQALGMTMIARAKGRKFMVYNGQENICFDAV